MEGQGARPAIVAGHDAETLFERSLVVARRHTFSEIVDEGKVGVVENLRLFHNLNAPVEVGREAIAQVIRHHEVASGKEGLVADEHPLAETFPCQYFGGREAAHAQEVAFMIYQLRFAIEHIGQCG